MAIRYDTHMHSSFSLDSDTPMESMILRAMELGLDGICFTEHMDTDYPSRYFPKIPHAFEADPEKVYHKIRRLTASLPPETGAAPFWIGFGLEFGM